MIELIFQSTPLIRGETLILDEALGETINFNPLPSYEGRPVSRSIREIKRHFNPLPSYEGRPSPMPFSS